MENLDYGVIGNCRTAALVSKRGSIDWFCLPDFDSLLIFAKLLDEEKGGSFHFEVSDEYTIIQNYHDHTNILLTQFESPEKWRLEANAIKAEDDFGVPTSSFTICTFWLIEALFVIGEKEEAREIFEKMISYSNHVGLYSEDLDFQTKQQLGNFPQA